MANAEGIIALQISKIKLLVQYAGKDIPDISCMCLRFFSLSFKMKDTTTAGINANPIETTNAMKNPLAVAALCLNFSVIGYG